MKELQELIPILEATSDNWEPQLYDKTGTILDPHYGHLISKCGYIDLFFTGEPKAVGFGSDCDILHIDKIKSLDDFVDFILNSESYREYLVDESFGAFTKSELFWAFHAKVADAEENRSRPDGFTREDWHIERIGAYSPSSPLISIYLDLIDYCDVDAVADISGSLDNSLDNLVESLNLTVEDDDYFPQYRVWNEKTFHVPNSFMELKDAIGIILR